MFLFVTGLFALGTSCRKEPTERVLTEAQMVQVLSEIYLAEDKINRMSLTPDSSKKVFNIIRSKIAEKTSVSDSAFRKSMEYYTAHPQKMERIYAALVDSLVLKEQREQRSPDEE